MIRLGFFDGENDTSLKDHEKEACDGLRSSKVCLQALKSVESQKTPCTDGLPAESYKVFWNDDISTTLIDALNSSFETRKLSITQRRGIIKLIPKEALFCQELETFNFAQLRLQNCGNSNCKWLKNMSL